MQIRRRKGKLEFLRSFYDSGKKRSSQKLIGSIDSWSTVLPDSIRAKLSGSEIIQIEDYLRKQAEESHEWKKKWKIRSAGEDLSFLALAITDVGVCKEQAATIYMGIRGVSKALRAAGFTRKALFSNLPMD